MQDQQLIEAIRSNKHDQELNIITTGWYNIDRFVYETTVARTTGNYTDPRTGKTATIKYGQVSFQINKPEQYDALYVYLLPDKLSSFMRLPQVNGTYTEKLNDQLKYKLICIAYKDDQSFYYQQPGIEPKAYAGIELSAITQLELTRLLNREGNAQQQSDVQKELEFIRSFTYDVKRRKRNAALEELWYKVFNMIYHCIVHM